MVDVVDLLVAGFFSSTITYICYTVYAPKWNWTLRYSGHSGEFNSDTKAAVKDTKEESSWYQLLRCSVPKHWFWQFYAYGLGIVAFIWYSPWSSWREHSRLLAALLPDWKATQLMKEDIGTRIAVTIFTVHVLQRLIESLRFRRGSARILLCQYIFGFAFYTAIPFSLFGHASSKKSTSALNVVTGTIISVFGCIWQGACHEYLISKKHCKGYVPLTGSGFRWLKGAHFFGEWVIYLGFAFLVPHWQSCLAFVSVFFSMLNIATSYAATQDKYSPEHTHRRIVVPFIY